VWGQGKSRSDADGSFEIKGVPPGTDTLEAWNERKKARPQKVTVKGGKIVRHDVALRCLWSTQEAGRCANW